MTSNEALKEGSTNCAQSTSEDDVSYSGAKNIDIAVEKQSAKIFCEWYDNCNGSYNSS